MRCRAFILRFSLRHAEARLMPPPLPLALFFRCFRRRVASVSAAAQRIAQRYH